VTIDRSAFTIRATGAAGRSSANSIQSGTNHHRWWTMEGTAAADAIGMTLNRMRDNMTLRASQWVISARLYGNLAPMALAGISFSKLAASQPALRDRVSYNVVQSVVDTVTSKIAQHRPRPLFLTSGGDYRQQRKAKALNKFSDGVFYENNTHALGVSVFRDAAVWGDGFIHVFPHAGRVRHERVLPNELFVDDVEAMYGQPRQLHRQKLVDRDVLLELFPDHADAIRTAATARLEDTSRGNISDVLRVVESWHLPSAPGAEDGRHCISIEGQLLTDMERWDHEWFPFARIQWTPRLFGYWGQGLSEQLMNLQMEINKLLWVIQRSFHLGGSFKVFLESGSKIVSEHLNNDIGAIVKYTGQPPTYATPPLVPPEIYGHLNTLVGKAYELAGVSQLSAGSMKPAGLNSGRALREMVDIESDRFAVIGRAYEQLFLDVAKLSIATVKQLAEEGDYSVTVPGQGETATVRWSDVNLDADEYVMQAFPVSSLPRDPAGRLQTIQEYAQAGFLSPRQARRLLDFPDLEQVEGLANASEDYLCSILDAIVDRGEYTPPEPFDDLAMAKEMALEYYSRGRAAGLEEERLDLLRTFLAQITELENPPPAPEAPGAGPDAGLGGMAEQLAGMVPPGPAGGTAAPIAPPVPLAPSDLVAQGAG